MKNTIRFANWLNKWSSWGDILTMSAATSIFVIIAVILLNLKRRKLLIFSSRFRTDKEFHGSQKRHNWHLNSLFPQPTFCNVCECVMVSGVSCAYCNLYADEKCYKKADKLFKCKQVCENIVIAGKDENFNSKSVCSYERKWQHQWVKGNLKPNSVCSICNESDCGNSPNLSDFKCVWCWRSVHEKCLNNVSTPKLVDECDLGTFRTILLKPNLVLIRTKTSDLSIKDVKLDCETISRYHSDPEQWTPLFVFANRKSGNNDADAIITTMTTILNPLQVIEMNKMKPDIALNWMAEYSDLIQFKILVCGGDGSVGWILECLSKIKFKKYEPAVAVLPLGTGNDLSRALKWGSGYIGEHDIEDILTHVNRAKPVKLDRWAVRIQKINSKKVLASVDNEAESADETPRKNIGKSDKVLYMNNYASIGCDALVTLNFHKERNNLFIANRIFNKLIYFKYGTIDTFLKECRNLTENIQLELDGKKIELPHVESIVILNIPFWGGGVEPWNLGRNESRTDIPETSINDRVLEVFGIHSSFHIAQMQVGLAEPFRIGQARRVRIKLNKQFPMQIDGEPWDQKPAIIEISHYNQQIMLESFEPF